jgi:hypothetical protein
LSTPFAGGASAIGLVALHRQHGELAELCGIGKAAGLRAFVLRDEVLQLAGVARAEHHLMSVLDETAGE